MDPFTHDYACRPASHEDWGVVYQVSASFKNTGDDPVLWTPLLTQDARNQAFRDHRNRCLNCGRDDHSMKHCPEVFTNSSGLLNPDLGLLNDGSQAFRRWQNRMRSYRRKSASSGPTSSQRGRRSNNSSQRRNSSNNLSNSYRNNGASQNNGNSFGNGYTQSSNALTLQPSAPASAGSMVPSTFTSQPPGSQSGGQNNHYNGRG